RPGVDELARARDADAPREALRAAEAWDHAELHLGLTEARLLGGMDEVARQGELAPSTEREAVHRRDHRERQRLERLAERVALPRERARLVGAHVLHRGDVGAGDERLLARAREDRRANAFGASELLRGVEQAREHR